MHEDDEGVDVVVVDDDPDQKEGNVEHAEVYDKSDAFRQRHQMQRVLELEVLICELQFLEQQEDDAVDDDSQLVLHARVNNRPEEINVICHEHPLEDQHVIHVFGAKRGFICEDDQRLIV